MKLLLLCLVLLNSLATVCQVDTITINTLINWLDNIKWDSVSTIEAFETTEGGSENYYFLNGEILKIQISDYGEMAQAQTKFYFEDSKVSYWSHFEYHYNSPMYISVEGIVKEALELDSTLSPLTIDTNQIMTDSGYDPWDFDKSKINSSKCYFVEGKLKLQINKTENGKSKETLPNEDLGSFINQYAEELLQQYLNQD